MTTDTRYDAGDGPLLVDVFRALAEAKRWEMLVEIARLGEVGMQQLEELVDLRKSSVSYHTRVLYDAGIIEVRKVGRSRYYRLRSTQIDRLIESLQRCAERPPTQTPAVVA